MVMNINLDGLIGLKCKVPLDPTNAINIRSRDVLEKCKNNGDDGDGNRFVFAVVVGYQKDGQGQLCNISIITKTEDSRIDGNYIISSKFGDIEF